MDKTLIAILMFDLAIFVAISWKKWKETLLVLRVLKDNDKKTSEKQGDKKEESQNVKQIEEETKCHLK